LKDVSKYERPVKAGIPFFETPYNFVLFFSLDTNRKRSELVFALGKALNYGLFRNQAYTQLHLCPGP
jgi:hypothetical protein